MNFIDIIIKNARIIDGCGTPGFKGDIGIKDEKIVKIGNLNGMSAKRIIDTEGLVACPGFIDIHSHTDKTSFINPKHESTIRQGITTTVSGNCGYSLAPINPDKIDLHLKEMGILLPSDGSIKLTWSTFHEYLSKIEDVGIASNMMLLVGHGAVRIAAMGFDNRAPTETELEIMKTHVEEAMEAGALGISTGLLYPPGIFAKIEELIELSKVVAQYKGYYFSHLRSYGGTLRKSVNEAIEIGEKARVTVQISHASIFGSPFWGKSKTLLRLVEKARAKGLKVNIDVHPYDSVMTDLQMLLPPWSFEGGKMKTIKRLKDPETRENIISQQKNGPENREDWPDWQPFNILGMENILPIMLKSEKYKPYEGKNVVEIAKAFNQDPFEIIIDIFIEEELDPAMIITHLRGEEDIINFIKSPYSAFETDASSVAPYGELSKNNTHPRAYGTYPKILGEFVRERKIMTLEEAIRKSTSCPAQMVGLLDRGILRPESWADVIIFNPNIIIDRANYANPHQYSIGVEYVIVNGIIVVEQENHTNKLPGKVLRHEA